MKKNRFNQQHLGQKTPPVETPYHRAQQVWDQRLGVFALHANAWRRIAIVCFTLLTVLVILLAMSLSWHKPSLYIAEVTKEGRVLNVNMVSHEYRPTQAQEEYFITQFIQLVRGLPLDPVAAKNNWLTAYNFLSDRGAKQLNEFFREHNPLPKLSKETVTVTINDINPVSQHVFQVDWTEESVNQSGQITGQKQMSGVFTIVVHPPKSKEEMLKNPLGIYIVDFNISPAVRSIPKT